MVLSCCVGTAACGAVFGVHPGFVGWDVLVGCFGVGCARFVCAAALAAGGGSAAVPGMLDAARGSFRENRWGLGSAVRFRLDGVDEPESLILAQSERWRHA